MKITKLELKRIIKEEIQKAFLEEDIEECEEGLCIDGETGECIKCPEEEYDE